MLYNIYTNPYRFLRHQRAYITSIITIYDMIPTSTCSYVMPRAAAVRRRGLRAAGVFYYVTAQQVLALAATVVLCCCCSTTDCSSKILYTSSDFLNHEICIR